MFRLNTTFLNLRHVVISGYFCGFTWEFFTDSRYILYLMKNCKFEVFTGTYCAQFIGEVWQCYFGSRFVKEIASHTLTSTVVLVSFS